MRVYFTTSATLADAPSAFDPRDPTWESRQSDGDYGVTNALFNRLDGARVAGTSLPKFLRLNDVSMWQFLPSYIWVPVYQAVELIRLVRQIVRDVHPAELRVFASRDGAASTSLWEGVVRSVASAHGVEVVVIGSVRRSLPTLVLLPIRTLARRVEARALVLRAQWLLIGRGARWINRLRTQSRPSAGKRVILVTFERHWVKKPFEPGSRYDEQMYPLLDALRARGWTRALAIDCPDGPTWRDVRSLWQRLWDKERVSWLPFYSYGATPRFARRATRTHFAEQWKLLRDDRTFAEDFAYEGVPLMPALRHELEGTFRVILPGCAEMLAIAKRILAEERPDGLIATYETGPFQRALIIEASRAGVPTVGLMHGMIFDNHNDYAYLRITTDPVRDPESFAVPRVTCVWGPFWKEVLTRTLHYPADAVAITGNWRYDRVLRLIHPPEQVDGKQGLGYTSETKTVVIVSGAQGTTDFVRECLNALAGLSDCVPLIKLHPVDDPEPVRALLVELGYASRTLVDGPLVEALTAADLVVSQVSTAVSEAVLLDRPVVLVDLLQSAHRQYVEAGVCLHVTNRANLADSIRTGLYDSTVQAGLASARRDFAERFFSPVDARSAERVVDALESRPTESGASPLLRS